LFSNHLTGQDTLHVDVCDKDPLKEDNIASLQIDLRDLYEKRICLWNQNLIYFFFFLLDHIDNWYSLPSTFGHSSAGEIHLIIEYQPLEI
jgi:hypothetical protein